MRESEMTKPQMEAAKIQIKKYFEQASAFALESLSINWRTDEDASDSINAAIEASDPADFLRYGKNRK
jgi:hypothetical protein